MTDVAKLNEKAVESIGEYLRRLAALLRETLRSSKNVGGLDQASAIEPVQRLLKVFEVFQQLSTLFKLRRFGMWVPSGSRAAADGTLLHWR